MSASASNMRICPKCGTELGPYAPEGQCPRCMLAAAAAIVAAPRESADDFPQSKGGATQKGSGTEDLHDTQAGGRFTSAAAIGQRFGDYELLEEIGRGGMGVVHKARQLSLGRMVAIKLLPFSATTNPDYVKRFRVEASAAASLQHPNIVAIHEVGVQQGQHYFAMDFVEGGSLARVVAAGPLPASRAARYVRIVAEAIEYAHQRGILHRDLKPSNILLDQFDQPRVTDFGLAKKLEGDSSLTLSGQVLGSPSYMPPEQCDGKRGKVGRRSDVYALGAMLYHLVTGRAPFVAGTVAETLQQVQTEEPVSPQLLNPSIPRDLATICLKCLEKEQEKRYATARALAEELARFLNNEPIQARPVGLAGKTWRWCRRKPALATALTGLLAVFVVGLAGILWQWQRAETSVINERREHDLAQGRLYAAQMKLAHASWKAGNSGGALELLRAHQPAPNNSDFRGFEWRWLYRLCQATPGRVLATNTADYSSVDCSPDGRVFALGANDGTLELLDASTLGTSKRWQAHQGAIRGAKFFPRQSRWLATAGGDDGRLFLWDAIAAHPAFATNCAKGLFLGLTVSPDGRWLAVGAPDGQTVNLWAVQWTGGVPSLSLKTNLAFIGPAEFSHDGRFLALGNSVDMSTYLALYDLAAGTAKPVLEGYLDTVGALAFSPDDQTMAVGGALEEVMLVDVESRRIVHTFKGEKLVHLTSVAFGPDGQTLFASGWDQNIRCWDLKKLGSPYRLRGHGAGVNMIALTPDGTSLISAGRDRTARLWPVQPVRSTPETNAFADFEVLQRRGPTSPRAMPDVWALTVAGDGRVAAATGRELAVYDLKRGTELVTTAAAKSFEDADEAFRAAAFSPDGRVLAAGGDRGRAALLDALTLKPLRPPLVLHSNQITDMDFALNGQVLVSGGGFGTKVMLTDVASGRLICEPIRGLEANIPVQPLAVSSDGRLLATGSPEQFLCVWDIASGRLLECSPQQVQLLNAVVFSPDGRIVVFSDILGSLYFWDRQRRHLVQRRQTRTGPPVIALAFSPDGRTLASASMDHTIKLWHPDIDQEVAILEGHTGWVWRVAFAERGNVLLSCGRDGFVHLRRALSFEEIEPREKSVRLAP